MVSDICSSISGPWVEISTGGSQVCNTMGTAEAIAITMMVTANNFAIAPHSVQRHSILRGQLRSFTDPAASCYFAL